MLSHHTQACGGGSGQWVAQLFSQLVLTVPLLHVSHRAGSQGQNIEIRQGALYPSWTHIKHTKVLYLGGLVGTEGWKVKE